MKNSKYFITGTDTDIGKTFISSILTEYLEADYWKPIQAGSLDNTDSMTVKSLLSNSKSKIFIEKYKLNTPASPHYAASIDKVDISLNDFELPRTDNNLIIEGAGGVLVPINEKDTILDLIKYLDIPVIVVSKNYLGSINHTLLTLNVLKTNGVNIEGIIFNGKQNKETQRIIKKQSGVREIAYINEVEKVDKSSIRELVAKINIDL